MRTLALIVVAAIVLAFVARLLVRGDSRLAESTRLASRLIPNIGMVLIFGWVAVELARNSEGLWLVLAAFLAVLAIGEFLLVAFFVWVLIRHLADDRT